MSECCPECGSLDLLPPDEDGLVDCENCGIWFRPGHPYKKECLEAADPDDIDPQAYLQSATRPLACPECGAHGKELTKDEEGVVDCMGCGSWFWPEHPEYDTGINCYICYKPTVDGYCTDETCPQRKGARARDHRRLREATDPDSLNLKLYIAQHYPRVEDQLEARGFDKWIYGVWRLNVEPSWLFEVAYCENDTAWNFRVTWLAKMALIHFENFKNSAALLFAIDNSLRKYQGRRYVATEGDDVVVENAASMPLAYGLMENDSDFYQPALPFSPAIKLGQATQRRLPYESPLEASYAPAPNKWTPPPKVYKQDPDDFDPWDYINAAPNCGERRITTSFSKITWHDPPDEEYDEENGWEDETGEDLTVDEFDDEVTTPVDKAVKFLQDKGAQDTGNDDWYDSEGEQDMHDGSTTTYAYHLKGYTEEELSAIYDRIVTRRRRWHESTNPDDPDAYLKSYQPNAPIGAVVTRFCSKCGHQYRVIKNWPDSAEEFGTKCSKCSTFSPLSNYHVTESEDPDDPVAFIQRMPVPWSSEDWTRTGTKLNDTGYLVWRYEHKSGVSFKVIDEEVEYAIYLYDPSGTFTAGEWFAAADMNSAAKLGAAYAEKELAGYIRRYSRQRTESADPDDPDAFMRRFYRGKPIKKVEVYGKRWWQRGPGNTYHSVQISVDGQEVASIDFVYGGGDQYSWTARDWLSRNGYLMAHDHHAALWSIAIKQGFQLVQDVIDVKRRRDLK